MTCDDTPSNAPKPQWKHKTGKSLDSSVSASASLWLGFGSRSMSEPLEQPQHHPKNLCSRKSNGRWFAGWITMLDQAALGGASGCAASSERPERTNRNQDRNLTNTTGREIEGATPAFVFSGLGLDLFHELRSLTSHRVRGVLKGPRWSRRRQRHISGMCSPQKNQPRNTTKPCTYTHGTQRPIIVSIVSPRNSSQSSQERVRVARVRRMCACHSVENDCRHIPAMEKKAKED
ncbi:hypothetical protein ZHAS_00011622 [Anopheles sinensis]|uniref:Uncharacterized protein n=1 Tax=Anopheles sinensis TaxID=74873 RepID=A0A084W0Z4_ANOSI|nr:hypothetical protein ZHAS_00011622 [Anopheles sinensis]